VRNLRTDVLSDNWYVLRKATFEYQASDGEWSPQEREAYDRGNGATILLYDEARGTLLLTRQFRVPAFLNGHPDGMLLEAPAGLLDGDDAASAIKREAEEETGVRVGDVRQVFELFMSPGSVTERICFFVAPYGASDRVSAGGGLAEDGEDLEVVELTFAEAWRMVQAGEIVDGKTVLLLQWTALNGIGAAA
jgi:nudix-type nucleoside diphosphatase (YffH/AdpP family)